MKTKKQISVKLFAFIMALLMLLVSLPVSAFASAISASSSDETNTSVNAESETVKRDVIVLEEDETLRDENTKHFKLSDGTTKAVVYSQAVHYKDADGKWVDIDNALTLNGSEYSSNNKSEIKFANESGSNGLVSIKDGDYKIDFTPLNTNKVSVVIENPQDNNSRKFEDMSVLNNLVSKAIYTNIYDGIDIEYILVGNNIKENIIVKEKQDSYTFSFELKLNKLSAELKDGAIILSDYDSGEQVYEIPAPYMFDANNVYSDNVEYSLVQKNKWKYTFTVTADAEWFNAVDRVFPVTVDPSVGTSSYGMESLTISSLNNPSIDSNILKVSPYYISYIKQSIMPVLPNDAYITDATLSTKRCSGTDAYVGVYLVRTDWDETLTWDEYEEDNKGYFIENPYDYNHITSENDWYTWNVTDIVKHWNITDRNYGMAFMFMEGSSDASFYSANSNYEPELVITYRDMKGYESQWSYITQNAGMGTTGYVNLATGNLMLNIEALTTTENLFGFTSSLIYNSALCGEDYKYSNAQVGYLNSYVAKGFKLNSTETLIKDDYIDSNGNTATYFVWADGDGTEHYFFKSTKDNEENIYYDEDGLSLKLIENVGTDGNEEESGTYCKIVDTSFSERIFTYYKDISIAGTYGSWYLSGIKDKSGNILRFMVDGSERHNDTKLTPNGTTDTIQLLGPLYNSDGVATLIWCNSSREGVVLRHSNTPRGELSTSGGKYLREILYITCDSSISWRDALTLVGDTDNEMEGVTVNNIVKFDYYEGGYINKIEDTLSGRILRYICYADGTVHQIAEYAKDENGQEIEGQRIEIEYFTNKTEVRSSGNDDDLYTYDDIINVYIFDNEGRVTTSYSTNATRDEIYGVSTGLYEDENENAKNSLKSSSILGVSSPNYLFNGSFEDTEHSTKYWNVTSNVVSYPTYGDKDQSETTRLKFDLSEIATASASQYVYLTSGKYTISLDVFSSESSDIELILKATSGTHTYIETIPICEERGTVDEYFATLTFEVNCTPYERYRIEISATSPTTTNSTIFVDNMMLAKSRGAADFNHVTHGGFEDTCAIENGGFYNSAVNYGDYWYVQEYLETENGTELYDIPIDSSTDNAVYIYENYDELFYNILAVEGSISKKQEVYQDILAKNNYDADYNSQLMLTVSGYGYSSSAMNTDKSEFGLKVYYEYEQNGETQNYVQFFPFSTDANTWQYTSGTVLIPKDAKLTYMCVACVYSHNIGTACFDNICVTKSKENTTTEYEYYDDGRIMYQKTGSSESFYHYNDMGELVDFFNDTTRIQYTYDVNHRVIEQDTYTFLSDLSLKNYDEILENKRFSLLDTKTKYTYDQYGLLVSTEIIAMEQSGTVEGEKIVTTNEYYIGSNCKIFGALKSTTDSLGQVTKYFRNEYNGRLMAIIEPDGKGLIYTYDAMGRLTMVQPAILSGTKYSVISGVSTDIEYVYNDKGQLGSIEANGTTYSFTYDIFGNQTDVSIGENVVASQIINENNGKILRTEYANGTIISYEYDEREYVSTVTYQNGENITVYTYEYDANGNLYKITDSASNTTTLYKYDLTGALTGHIEYNTETGLIGNSNFYVYDEQDRLKTTYHNIDYLVNDTSNEYYSMYFSYSYYYTNDENYDRIYIHFLDEGSNYIFEYDYDEFDRVIEKHVTLNDSDRNADGYHLDINGFVDNIIQCSYITNEGQTSLLVGEFVSKLDINDTVTTENVFKYEYDKLGNIIAIRNNSNQIIYSYEYDVMGQLVRENNAVTNETYLYNYDDNGNLTSVYAYNYTLDASISGAYKSVDTYTYGNAEWKDQLTSFNNQVIEYDEIGNPIKYLGFDLTWNKVNNLASISKNDETIASYTYNDEGIRTSKTVNGVTHTYSLEGNIIVFETYGDVMIVYFYDEVGLPIGMAYRDGSETDLTASKENQFTFYLFTKNLQGDILNIYDVNGAIVASYVYDAWGNHTVTNYTSDNIGSINPFRYRGYFYDCETGFYYLNSRYYDPEIRRFISADSVEYLGEGPLSTAFNLYTYCYNNPIMYYDPNGNFGAGTGALFAGAFGFAAMDGPLPIGDIIACGMLVVGFIDLAINGPVIDIPSIDVPSVDIPSIDVPSVDIPSIDVPDISIPNDNSDVIVVPPTIIEPDQEEKETIGKIGVLKKGKNKENPNVGREGRKKQNREVNEGKRKSGNWTPNQNKRPKVRHHTPGRGHNKYGGRWK